MKNLVTRKTAAVMLSAFAAVGFSASWSLNSGAATDPAYTEGVKLYSSKNYREAAVQFEAAMKTNPNSPDVIYYCALCHQLSNNRTRAKQLFEFILSRFPTSRVAMSAATGLRQISTLSQSVGMEPPYQGRRRVQGGRSMGGQMQVASSSRQGNDADLATVPDEVKIPFEKHGDDIIIMVAVNNKTVPFILDTGAATVVMGQNHLQSWGIVKGEAQNKFAVGGVGDGVAQGWMQNLDLKVGQIYRRDFPCMIQDHLPTEPLLGQTFLRSFNVSIDDASKTVTLAKKGGSAASRVAHRTYFAHEIPFTRNPGGHMLVDVMVNGRKTKMIFDTGAEGTCFTTADCRELGIQIPSDARQSISNGVLGSSKTYNFPIDRLQCGKIINENFMISVIESNKSIKLLGMSFYGRMKYAIDTNKNVIVFSEQ